MDNRIPDVLTNTTKLITVALVYVTSLVTFLLCCVELMLGTTGFRIAPSHWPFSLQTAQVSVCVAILAGQQEVAKGHDVIQFKMATLIR